MNETTTMDADATTFDAGDRRRVMVEGISREEAGRIEEGLRDPAIRSFVLIAGVLRALPSDRARRRVLAFVEDQFEEAVEGRDNPRAYDP